MKTKTVGKLLKDAQVIFNKWIRNRDEGKPCISCGKILTLQAGHFYAVSGWSGLRFDEDNVHGECSRCNCFDERHLLNYQENLKIRIGTERYYKLKQRAEAYKRDGYKWTRQEIIDIIEKYRL